MTRLQFFMSIPALVIAKIFQKKENKLSSKAYFSEYSNVLKKANEDENYSHTLFKRLMLIEYEWQYGRDDNGHLNEFEKYKYNVEFTNPDGKNPIVVPCMENRNNSRCAIKTIKHDKEYEMVILRFTGAERMIL